MNDSMRFPLIEDVEALYEADIGPVDIRIDSGIPARHDKKITEKARDPGNVRASMDEDGKDAGKKMPAKGKYEDDGLDEESYIHGFGLKVSGAYFDEKEKSLKIEYKLLPADDAKKAGEADVAAWREIEATTPQKSDDLMPAAAGNVTYSSSLSIEKYTESVLGSEVKATYDSGVLNIEYKNVELINGQKTYQRIVLKAESDGESVYDLTVRKLGRAGIETETEYDSEFEGMIFTSINGRAEGAGGNFNEFYVNGEIGGNSADKQKLKKDDYIEWRNAEEVSGCGGSPDFESIKSALEYSTVAMMQAQQLGLLAGRPYSAFHGFSGGLTFH
jgi:hypothetical protein